MKAASVSSGTFRNVCRDCHKLLPRRNVTSAFSLDSQLGLKIAFDLTRASFMWITVTVLFFSRSYRVIFFKCDNNSCVLDYKFESWLETNVNIVKAFVGPAGDQVQFM